jgi:hypothetical protein
MHQAKDLAASLVATVDGRFPVKMPHEAARRGDRKCSFTVTGVVTPGSSERENGTFPRAEVPKARPG